MTAPAPVREVEGTVPVVLARKALGGFFLSGLLMSFLGAVLPAWGYHLRFEFHIIANYFLALNLGILISVPLANKLLKGKGLTVALVTASALACASLLYLAAMGPPAPSWTRWIGVSLIGAAAGLLNTALFHAISPVYRRDPAATVNLSGVAFGLGCLVAALLVYSAFYVYTTGAILFLLAVIPGIFVGAFLKNPIPMPELQEPRPLRQALSDFQSPAAILFALLLFFQFGNEWAIAGWLPLFLMQRLGVSPETSLLLLSFYWFALMVGRIAAQVLLARVAHGRLLAGSVLAAFFGCLIVTFTDNLFGAVTGVLLIGGGFAMIYPLVVERIGSRFPYYHPGFFNGLFSLAVTGGLLAPWTMGYFANWWGIQMAMVVPLFGTVAVFALVGLIWLEALLTAPPKRA